MMGDTWCKIIYTIILETDGQIGQRVALTIRRSRVQLWPSAKFVCSPKFNSSTTLINNQLVCLLPVEIFSHVTFSLDCDYFSGVPVNYNHCKISGKSLGKWKSLAVLEIASPPLSTPN